MFGLYLFVWNELEDRTMWLGIRSNKFTSPKFRSAHTTVIIGHEGDPVSLQTSFFCLV